MNKDQFRKSLKKIPLVLEIHEILTRIPRTYTKEEPGDFIFSEKTVSWLSRPDLKMQLPPLYRLFALLCTFNIFGSHAVNTRFRKKTFSIILYITRTIRLKDTVQINLPEYKVCINLLDPRCLKVVDELIHNTDRLTNFLSEGDTFIDVGANHGSYSIIACKIVGESGFVLSIEPQPRLAKLLNSSLLLNNYSKFEVHQIACGDRQDSVDMFIPEYNSGEASIFSSLSATHKHQTINVQFKPFDKAFEWRDFPGNIFVKLDIEGGEYAFLKGAREMICTRMPSILLEINPHSLKSANITETALKELLRELGYSYFSYLNNTSEQIIIERLDFTREHDIILIPAIKNSQF